MKQPMMAGLAALGLATLGLATLGLAGPAQAEETRFGPVEIVDVNDLERGLSFGGEVNEIPSKPYLAFVEAQYGDWLLLAVSQGGNACAAEYTWAVVSAEGVTFSPVFGTCAELTDISQGDGGVTVEIDSLEAGSGPIRYFFDGAVITEEQAPLQGIGWSMGQPGEFWVGRYLFDLFDAAELDGALRDIMDPKTLETARKNAQLTSPMERQGDWVVGVACEKNACDANEVAVAVSMDGNRIVVALREGGDPVGVFGDLGDDEFIPAFEDVLAP
ncbi:hypothetical protein [Maritimibacter sp. DP1N21-5]|uniref:hypothetical protein n=1 Tax=Maritimibacter sp. DP1N21-5 TaxID=2836867 RepID=UPI001C45351A|nr:hypothetical protein [Maritimibacter sp. DP1N21-5]MBV7410240.1 hypothetical protein [Maritimibacter sp. DP1N21-5]